MFNSSPQTGGPGDSAGSGRDVAPGVALPWVVRLRYGIACGEAAIVLTAALAFGLRIPLIGTIATLLLVLGSNLLLAQKPQLARRFPEETLGAVFVLDTLSLTVVLGLTGGPANPFSLLYLVQITLSAVVLSKAWTWALGLLSTACFGLLFLFDIPVPALEMDHLWHSASPHLVGMWTAFIVAAGLITFFTGKVSDELRRREHEVLALQEKIAKSERLASLATLAAGAAHELGTPLGTIAVVSRELERYASQLAHAAEIREDATLIRSEVERCRLILQKMSLDGAEPVGEAPRRIRCADLLELTLRQFTPVERDSIAVEIEDDVTAVLPVQATTQSIAALLKNALHASAGQAKIAVRAGLNGSSLEISVVDHGQGMPETVLRRIAEPFFTTKDPGKGMGLGTFLARTFAERLGGSLSFESAPGKGTTARLHLPRNASRKDSYVTV